MSVSREFFLLAKAEDCCMHQRVIQHGKPREASFFSIRLDISGIHTIENGISFHVADLSNVKNLRQYQVPVAFDFSQRYRPLKNGEIRRLPDYDDEIADKVCYFLNADIPACTPKEPTPPERPANP